uniref:Uncharacterized protein n=1 Tax=Caenorhabditis japonica TaxID=281687 RepID=A0A8R1EHC8_CAEJA
MSSEEALERTPAVAVVEFASFKVAANRTLSRVGVLSLLVVGDADVGVKSSREVGEDGCETPLDTLPLSMEVLKLVKTLETV